MKLGVNYLMYDKRIVVVKSIDTFPKITSLRFHEFQISLLEP
jgi:hypothetical protein